jgi:dihydrofolate synthase/folylpolyglutamate synthase
MLPLAPAIAPILGRLAALGGELLPPSPGSPRRKFELAHMRTLLEALGSPHRRFPSVLIAGTNGKGSTAATLASILQAAGHRVGLYTSPHLEQPNERIRINGVPISDEALALHFIHVETTAARLVAFHKLPHTPSFFETITAIAFLHFAGLAPDLATTLKKLTPTLVVEADPLSSSLNTRGQTTQLSASTIPGPVALKAEAAAIFDEKVEIAVLEVGLGGRLDATNVVLPLVSVITDISLDHTEWLGSTIAEITREKAGILHPRSVLVTLPQHPEANQVIGEVAVPLEVEAINAADYLPPRLAERTGTTAQLLRNQYNLTLPTSVLDGATLSIDSPLAGAHQQRNIALAIATAVVLQRPQTAQGAFRPVGFSLTPEAIEEGIRNTQWPGRLQFISAPAGSKQAPVLLDAAHNPAGAWALRAALSPLPIEGHRTLIFGCMADKELPELATVLFPVFDSVLLTRIDSPRAASLQALQAAAAPTGAEARTFQSSTEALSVAFSETPVDGLIVIAGSIALLGELLPFLSENQL